MCKIFHYNPLAKQTSENIRNIDIFLLSMINFQNYITYGIRCLHLTQNGWNAQTNTYTVNLIPIVFEYIHTNKVIHSTS